VPETLTDKEALALTHLDEHPIRTRDEVTTMVERFLGIVGTITNEEDAASTIAGEEEYFEVAVNLGFAVKSDSGEETIPESSVLQLYRYPVVDSETDAVGAVIASADKRLGDIIAYIEQESDDPVVTPFMEMFIDNLTSYTQKTIDEYNSITQEEINAAREKAKHISANTKQVSLPSAVKTVMATTDTSFKPLANPTKWNQGSGYWEVVNSVLGTEGVYAGCVAVAMAIVMAYHEYPGSCNLTGEFDNPFDSSDDLIEFKNVTYDWKKMKQSPYISSLINTAKLGINVLLYEAGVNVNMGYGTLNEGGSGALMINITPAMSKMTYDTESGLIPYDIETIITSINRQQPVIIGAHSVLVTVTWTETVHHWADIFNLGWWSEEKEYSADVPRGGHAWVIDDYIITYNEERGYLETETITWKETLVHCNLGWGGQKNGWYKSGLFDTDRATPIDDIGRSVTNINYNEEAYDPGKPGYFKYDMEIIPFLKSRYK
jgi:hypothetical protein